MENSFFGYLHAWFDGTHCYVGTMVDGGPSKEQFVQHRKEEFEHLERLLVEKHPELVGKFSTKEDGDDLHLLQNGEKRFTIFRGTR